MQDYQTRVQNYIQQNYPNSTADDVLGRKEIVKKEYPHLLGTLPYRTTVKGATFTTIPVTLQHKLSFNVRNETVDVTSYDLDAPPAADSTLNITKSLVELAGKKITLSYSPATAQDESVINSYLPKPHADGTPIQPNEFPSSLPAYLINVKPELRIDGLVVATGSPVGLGGTNIFTLTFSDPSYGSNQVINYIDAGVYQAIGINLGRISQNQLVNLKGKLLATKAKLQNNDPTGLTKDDLLGDLLYTNALTYLAELDSMNNMAAKTKNVNAITLPSETIFATKLRVSLFFGIPRFVSPGGLNMDADYLMQVVKAKDGNNDTAKQYMLLSGITSSTLENGVPEQYFSTLDNPVEGFSAIKALRLADNQGITIYTIDHTNITTNLPLLQVDQQVKDDIQNAVNAGKIVIVSKSNISYNGWNGCGYVIINPETGAGAYMISGGLNGAALMVFMDMFVNFSAWSDAWNNICQYWGDALIPNNITSVETADCANGTWYGYGVDIGANALYGGNTSIMKYVCSSNPDKTCTAWSSCFTGGVNGDYGVNVIGCRIQNTPNFRDFPNTFAVTIAGKALLGLSFGGGPGAVFWSAGLGAGGGVKASLTCRTLWSDCK